MLLLVTDTSGRNGSVALASAEVSKEEVHGIEAVPLAGGTFSAGNVWESLRVGQCRALRARDAPSSKSLLADSTK